MEYYTGHIDRFWKDDFKSLAYTKQPLMQNEIDAWIKQGYDHVKSFSGQMYSSANEMPPWVSRFDSMFGLKNQTYNFYKMSTLEIMPEHIDHFTTYMRLFGSKFENIRRVLVMLESWKPGHYLEICGVGFVNWNEGDYFVWSSDCPHAASNIGIEDRYTLQITGEKI